jgi:hypothetical protein
MVVTLYLDVLREVWLRLPPRQSEVRRSLWAVCDEADIGFEIPHDREEDLAAIKPHKMLSAREYSEVITTPCVNHFTWRQGLFGGGMVSQHFAQMVENEITAAGKFHGGQG